MPPSGPNTIGEANVVFTAETSGLRQGTEQAKRSINDVQETANRSQRRGGIGGIVGGFRSFLGFALRAGGIAFVFERIAESIIAASLNLKQLTERTDTFSQRASNLEEAEDRLANINAEIKRLNQSPRVGPGIFDRQTKQPGFTDHETALLNSINRLVEQVKNSITGGISDEDRLKELQEFARQTEARIAAFNARRDAAELRKLQDQVGKLTDEVKKQTQTILRQQESSAGTFNQILAILGQIGAGQVR